MKRAPASLGRRSVIQALGATAGAVVLTPWLSDQGLLAFAELQQTGGPAVLKVLSPAEFETLQGLVETILPADERSPGAREARVAEYIDLLVAESEEPGREKWLLGLRAVEAAARSRFGQGFLALEAAQAEALLTEWSVNEKAPQTLLEAFFKQTKDAAIHGYYTSEIGIHRELRYQGNTFAPEFVGCLTEDGKDCPHCGQKASG